MKFLIVTGSIGDGFTFTGPFDTPDEAVAYAERAVADSWWIAPLNAVGE
jgi:hypothetical protein